MSALKNKTIINEAASADIVHLTFKPPFIPGSFNRMIGVQMERMQGLRQRAISYWDGPPPQPEDLGADKTILANSNKLSVRQRCILRMPYQVRRRLTGIGARDWLVYVWKMQEFLRELQPKVVIGYDSHNLGLTLRRFIDWPCRLVLSQHGLSYFLDVPYSRRMYSLQCFDAIHTLSRVSYNLDRSRLPTYDGEVTVLPNWVDTDAHRLATCEEKRQARVRWGLPEDRKIVLLLSRLVPSKGAHLLLASWSRVLEECPDAYLWIVGGAEKATQPKYDDYLRTLINAQGLQDTVRLQGAVQPDLTATCYAASDVYVFPTLAAEGCGLSLLEAMATELPCIASDYPVGREMFTEREVVFVPNPNIADAFVEPIIRLLQDGTLRSALGAKARKAIEERYSYDRLEPQIQDFYLRQIRLTGRPVSAQTVRSSAMSASKQTDDRRRELATTLVQN